MNKEIQQWRGKHKQLQLKYSQLLTKCETTKFPDRDFDKYFPNEILYESTQLKQFIIQTLQKRYQSEVTATKLIHRYDQLNLTNLHKYIDGIRNILLLVKLKNGRIVAGFSNQAFGPRQKGKDGIIMAVQDKQAYFVNPGMNAITYDQFAMIFGNSELLIKASELMIYSNFGISKGFYQHEKYGKKQNADDLFKQGRQGKELPITSYEIYELVFKSP